MDIQIIGSGSKGNCYKIDDGHGALLLDAGISFREIQKALNFKLFGIDGTLITHEHGDHIKAAKDLAKRGVDIYASPGTFRAHSLTGHRYKQISHQQTIQVDQWQITAFAAIHDAAEPLSFLVKSSATGKSLVYITDSAYTRYTFGQPDYLLIEANYSKDIILRQVDEDKILPLLAKRIIENHMSIETAIELLKANDLSKLKAVYLLHLSDANSNAAEFKQRVQQVTGCPVYIA